jgi:hypothetical protein
LTSEAGTYIDPNVPVRVDIDIGVLWKVLTDFSLATLEYLNIILTRDTHHANADAPMLEQTGKSIAVKAEQYAKAFEPSPPQTGALTDSKEVQK